MSREDRDLCPSSPGRVRPEYAALATEFGRLAALFGHAIDAELRSDIARLAATMECIDRHVDDVSSDATRVRLWTSIAALLEHGDELGPRGELSGELARTTLDIREVARRRGVLARVLRLVRKEIATSESMRTTRRRDDYVAAVLREGRLTAALALVVAGPRCGARFRRFFFRLGGPANVIDKLRDARSDHARGEILIRPGILLHARLALAVAVRLPALVSSHPCALDLFRLGARYLAGDIAT